MGRLYRGAIGVCDWCKKQVRPDCVVLVGARVLHTPDKGRVVDPETLAPVPGRVVSHDRVRLRERAAIEMAAVPVQAAEMVEMKVMVPWEQRAKLKGLGRLSGKSVSHHVRLALDRFFEVPANRKQEEPVEGGDQGVGGA